MAQRRACTRRTTALAPEVINFSIVRVRGDRETRTEWSAAPNLQLRLVIDDWTVSPGGAPPGFSRFFLNVDDITDRIAARETVVQLRVLEGAKIRTVHIPRTT